MIGREITQREFNRPVQFLRGDSESGHALSRYLAMLQQSQLDPGPVPTVASRYSITPEDFPFADLLPFWGQDTLDFGRNYLRDWCAVIKPLVVVSLGKDASSVAAADFQHPFGLPEARFHTQVGRPRKIRYSPLDWVDGPPIAGPAPGLSAILVPCMHPGYLKHGDGNLDAVRQLIIASFDQALLLCSRAVTMMLIDAQHDDIVSDLFDWYYNSPSTAYLRRRIDQLSATLEAHYDRIAVARPPLTEAQRAVRCRINQAKIQRHEFTMGQPGSPERQAQVLRLWRMNYRALHVIHSRNDREGWFRWALGLPLNRSYFASAISNCSHDARYQSYRPVDAPANWQPSAEDKRRAMRDWNVEMNTQLLATRLRPQDAVGDAWMLDPVQVAEAQSRWGRYMASFQGPDRYSSENQRRIRALRGPPASVYHHDQVVPISGPNRWIRLTWHLNTESAKDSVYLRNGFIAKGPQLGDRTFRVYFEPEGYVSRMTRASTGEDKRVLAVPKSMFAIEGKGERWFTTWAHEREAITGTRPTFPPGRRLPASMTRVLSAAELARLRDRVRPEDALGRVAAFLDEVLPRGGVVSNGHPLGYPRTSMVDRWRRFMNAHGGPWTEYLVHFVNYEGGEMRPEWTRAMSMAFRILRPGSTHQSLPQSSVRGRTFNGIQWSITPKL